MPTGSSLQQRNDRIAVSMLFGHGLDLSQFVVRPLAQQGRERMGGGDAVIDNPCPWLDACATQVCLQAGSLQDRRGFRQCHQQDFGLFLVLKPHHRSGDVHLLVGYLARDFTVIRTCRIEQQQGVARGGGVHHDEFLAGLADDTRKCAEDGDFLRARRTQIFFQQRAALGIEHRALRIQDMLLVDLYFRMRVDPAHGEVVQRAVQRFGKMGSRVRRRQVYWQSTMSQLHGHRRG